MDDKKNPAENLRPTLELRDLTKEEKKAIAALKRVAKRWPPTLWLYSASGSLNVMLRGEDGQQVSDGEGVDQDYSVDTINIPNDGGDWRGSMDDKKYPINDDPANDAMART